MTPLTANELYSLEQYHKLRREFRAKVLEHKKTRQVPLGPNATLYFEDRLTIQYQVQEMLRIERIFESEAIEEELAAYNPLIPDGSNLKATFMIEYPDVEERRQALERLAGIEDAIYAEIEGAPGRVAAIADEDLERTSDSKTAAVHFLRFELDPGAKAALKSGASLKLGCTHPEYRYEVQVTPPVRDSLAADLD
ncbi:MAG TPA: DUF3501 family protein [Gammaproteobacteria bacterium]|nr:DUF3501 family protein [Gammaproteobacteria bacterium]